MKTKIIAIIPARGGSKGIPRKNVRLIAGKPLIAYSIEAALNSKYIEKAVVSTEDGEIAKISKKYGAEVIERPMELATDTAPTEPVLEHVVKWLQEQEGYKPDIVVLLQPTSPFRTSEHIDEALDIFLNDDCDSLLSVCPSSAFVWKMGAAGAYPINYDFKNRPRRQDKEHEYQENGAIYITTYNSLMENHNRLGGKIGLYIMPEVYSVEIDTEFDFYLCEQIINSRGEKRWDTISKRN
ncbi:N-acylneuraminate cytidylyltransferase [Candidatus Methanophagaceae archaeon]|nr:N-acylneuraminate cytidylyltransferase [Methanophagales archaeon]